MDRKILFIIFTAFVIKCAQGSNKYYLDMGRSIVKNNLTQFLEESRSMLRTGNETWGTPVMDPLEIETFKYSFLHESIKFHNFYNKMIIDGLAGFVINNSSYDPSALKIHINVTFPTVNISSEYELHSELLGLFYDFPVYGSGNVTFRFTNITLVANISLGWTFFGRVFARNVQSYVTHDGIEIDAKGIYDSDTASSYISSTLSTSLPYFLSYYHEQIMKALDRKLVDSMNDYFDSLSLQEIFYILSN